VSTFPATSKVSDLAGFVVTQCLFDYGLSLVLSRGPQSALLRIEGLFKLKLDGDWEIDPSGDRSSLCPSLKLFKRTIESAALLGTRELELVFSGDARLSVYGGREYEAWTLNLPDGTLVVSGTDGEVSVFPKHHDRRH